MMKNINSYWNLVRSGEPYRLLFPLGTFLGILGVLLWPAHVWLGTPYPLHSHAAIMIQGFLTCFVIGFLGTALPRLLGVYRMGLVETCFYGVSLALVSLLQLNGAWLSGNSLFLSVFIVFLTCMGQRAAQRKDIPPPGFVLVILGLFCAFAGAVILVVDGSLTGGIPYWLLVLGKCLLFQGYLLLPIMGIGAFLLPRFFGLPNRQQFPETLVASPEWLARARFALFCGMAVIFSFLCEALGWWRIAFGLRAVAILVYILREVPVHRAAFGQGSLALALRVALLSVPAGYLAMAFFPQWQMTLIHIVFITGFSLLTFTVASRVVLGHSGQEAKFRLNLKPVWAFTLLFVLAMLTRVTADWMPAIRLSHYGYASLCWVAAALVWVWYLMPGVRLADSSH